MIIKTEQIINTLLTSTPGRCRNPYSATVEISARPLLKSTPSPKFPPPGAGSAPGVSPEAAPGGILGLELIGIDFNSGPTLISTAAGRGFKQFSLICYEFGNHAYSI